MGRSGQRPEGERQHARCECDGRRVDTAHQRKCGRGNQHAGNSHGVVVWCLSKGARQTSQARWRRKRARVQVWSLVSGDKGLYKGLQQREGWRGATPLVSPPGSTWIDRGFTCTPPLVFLGQDLKKVELQIPGRFVHSRKWLGCESCDRWHRRGPLACLSAWPSGTRHPSPYCDSYCGEALRTGRPGV